MAARTPDKSDRNPEATLPRRRFLALCGLAGLALGVGWRATGYRRFSGWRGEVLWEWEAEVLAAVAETVLPDEAGADLPAGPPLQVLAENVDRFLVALPPPLFWLHYSGILR